MDFGKIQLVILVDLYSPGTPGPFVLCVSSRKQTMGKGAGAGADGHEADKEVSSFLLVVQKKKGGGRGQQRLLMVVGRPQRRGESHRTTAAKRKHNILYD